MNNIIEFPQDYFYIDEAIDDATGEPFWIFGKVVRRERHIIDTFDDRRSATWALATTEEHLG